MDFYAAIRGFNAERVAQSLGIRTFVNSLRSLLAAEGIATRTEAHDSRDHHLFFQLASSPNHAVHIQFYPGMSTDTALGLYGRVMDISRMIALREAGGCSPGSEHEAVVCELPSLSARVPQSWNPNELLAKLVADLKVCKPLS